MKFLYPGAAMLAAMLCGAFTAHGRVVPERDIPVPATVSPLLNKFMGAGLADWWGTKPQNDKEWADFVDSRAERTIRGLPDLRNVLNVESQAGEMGGVPVYTLWPLKMPPEHKNMVLLHLHGGGYVLNPGEAGTVEAVYLAGMGGFRVVSVDYRMPPKHPYPAALDDALSVYRALLNKYAPQSIGVFGTSTGGGMTLALALRIKAEGLPMPGALAAGTPWTDLTKTGDSYFTNEKIDAVLVSYDGWLDAAAKAYANGHDLKDPFISPIYGDVKGFPPTILGTGTRDLFLSNTARMHRKLREAGVTADMLVIEGLSHAEYMLLPPQAPESIYYFSEVARFFGRHLKN